MNAPVELKQKTSGRAAVFNIDGTLSDDRARRALVPTDARSMADFAPYHEQLERDPVIEYGAAILANHISNGDFIVLATGRPMRYADQTVAWVQKNFGMIPQRDFVLLCRADHDERSTVELKGDFVTYLQTNLCPQKELTIVAAYDNRRDVVEMYKARGLDATILNHEGEFVLPQVTIESEITEAPPAPPELGKVLTEKPAYEWKTHLDPRTRSAHVQHPTGENLGGDTIADHCQKVRDRFDVNVELASDALKSFEALSRQGRPKFAGFDLASEGSDKTVIANHVETVDHKPRKYSKYFKDVRGIDELDIYLLLDLFEITDHAIGHAVKKLLLAGVRSGGKPAAKDIEEARDTLNRYLEIRSNYLARNPEELPG